MRILIKYIVLSVLTLVLYILAKFFLIGVVRYHAFMMLLKSRGKSADICLALILIWYSHMYGLFWLFDILSLFNKDRIIGNIFKNMKVFNHEHLTLLMKKILTKNWWKQLKTRKPSYEIVIIMRFLWIPIIYHAVVAYSSGYLCYGALIFQTQFINFAKLSKCKKTAKCKTLQCHQLSLH